MADIDYPCRLPGVLVNSNSYALKNVVRRNDLASGPPLYILEDDSAYVMFSVAWNFSAIEMQVFRNFFTHTLARGSKKFNIALMVDGFDGDKKTKTHECYFDGVYQAAQNRGRWSVSATLLAIEEIILDECDSESLINAYNFFDYPLDAGIEDVNSSIELMEQLWQP